MAEASTEITVTPKQLGKHLRSIRRKKGLSLSEVARGAGLSRRELVGYERGKVPIPESDLWVLAGSCGVDVSELLPTTTSMELTVVASATSIGDTISALRQSQADAGITPYLHTLQKLQALPAGKRIPVKERELEDIATALGSTPQSIEERLQEVLHVDAEEAERLRAMIVAPPSRRGKPRALAAAPSAEAAAAAAAAAAVAPAPVPAPPIAPLVAEPATAPSPETVEPAEPALTFPAAPAAFLDQPLDAPIDPVHGHNIDVFEELARLPEPLPLGDPSAPVPDLLAPPDVFAAPPLVDVPAVGPPEGTVELVDSAMPATTGVASGNGDTPPATTAADAPPIDVAVRQGSSTWDLGEPPLPPPSHPVADTTNWETDGWQPPVPEGAASAAAGFWEGTDDWTPSDDDSPLAEVLHADAPATEVVDDTAVPTAIGEDTWGGSTWDPQPWTSTTTTDVDTSPPSDANPWLADEWPTEPAERGAWEHRPDQAAVDTGFYVDWGTPETETPPGWGVFAEPTPDPTAVAAPAEPVDHQTPETTAVPTLDTPVHTTAEPFDVFARLAPAGSDTVEQALVEQALVEDALVEEALVEQALVEEQPIAEQPITAPPIAEQRADDDPHDESPVWDHWAGPAVVGAIGATVAETEAAEEADATDALAPVGAAPTGFDDAPAHEPAAISWHAEGPAPDEHDVAPTVDATTALEPDWRGPDPLAEPATFAAEPLAEIVEPDDEPAPFAEEFVTAGPDWQLGNALPLVEVRGQGGLVMRRADERWALADVITTSDFVAEVEVDFRSGPGLGVLFRASIDDEGRMSGYSFDIDPIYDGGGYLVRQWQADRELWNPIARVSGDDPASMYGALLVRIEVTGEHLRALVNDAEVLTVENLKQASADRGRDAATGDRVGVQAWSSSDLVIDTVRVATR